MKTGAIILLMLLGVILALWIGMQLLRPREQQPELHPLPGNSMWDTPPANR